MIEPEQQDSNMKKGLTQDRDSDDIVIQLSSLSRTHSVPELGSWLFKT